MRHLLFCLFCSFILTGCTALTTIEGSWANQQYATSPFSKVAVFCVGAKSFIAQATTEQAITKKFAEKGVTSTAASDMFNPKMYDADNDGKIDDPDFRQKAVVKLNELGFDAVMLVIIKDVKSEERYVPGTVTYQPTMYNNGWYGNWNNYYSNSYQTVETPGYTATDVTAFVEANLYDLHKDVLAWSAQTSTFNPTSLQDAADSFANAIVPNIVNSGVVNAKTKE